MRYIFYNGAMRKKRVGVLRGGPSSEYEVSLDTGDAVLKNMPDHYEPVDVFIDKKAVWHIHGIRHDVKDVLKKIDVAFNAMHGEYGEDGQVQELMDRFGVKYTGSKAFPSRVAMNKGMTKEFLIKECIKTPLYKIIKRKEFGPNTVSSLYQTFPQPSVVKPLALGSSVGVSIAGNAAELAEALDKAFSHSDAVLIEEFIKGREATCGVIDNFAGEEFHALAPIEIVPPTSTDFYDYDAKYVNNETKYIIPGNFSELEKKQIQTTSALVHKALGLRHYSRSDFIVNPRRGVYFLEVNTLPGMTSHSLIPKAVAHAGQSFTDFLDHVITLALKD